MKDNPALSGGPLKSKPTWWNTSLHHVGFFFAFEPQGGRKHQQGGRSRLLSSQKYTPAASKWLAERGFVPLLCVPNSA